MEDDSNPFEDETKTFFGNEGLSNPFQDDKKDDVEKINEQENPNNKIHESKTLNKDVESFSGGEYPQPSLLFDQFSTSKDITNITSFPKYDDDYEQKNTDNTFNPGVAENTDIRKIMEISKQSYYGGPSVPPNKTHNQFHKSNNNDNNKNPKKDDAMRIKNIMAVCEKICNESINQYDNYKIKEAIKSLCKAIKGLDELKKSILDKKTSFASLLPEICSLRNKAFKKLQEFRINLYLIINLKFRPVPYDQSQSLADFSKRYLLTEPFISFNDIFDPAMDKNKKLKFVMNDIFQRSQRMGYKSLLLYGPRGSGKTLAVHALAHDLGGKVAQIEGNELLKIPYFAMEFVKSVFNYMQFKPLIVYIKNMEDMFSYKKDFNFLYDKTSSTSLKNVILIASSTVPVQMLPKEISNRFHYVHCIRPVEKNQKLNYIKFLSERIGIKFKMSDEDLNSFAFQYLNNYSNGDIFNLIKTAIDMKKTELGEEEEIKVYKDGLNDSDLMKALKAVPGTLTPDVIRNYYL